MISFASVCDLNGLGHQRSSRPGCILLYDLMAEIAWSRLTVETCV